MQKPLNLRVPCAVALSFAAGIACAYALFKADVDGFFVLVPFGAFCFLCAYFALAKKPAIWVFVSALVALIFLFGALYTYVLLSSLSQADVPLGELCEIEGRVAEVGSTAAGGRYIIVENATTEGEKLGGKVIAYLEEKAGDYCERGYKVTFLTTLNLQAVIDDGDISYRAIDGIKYYCTVYGGMDATSRFSLFAAVQSAISEPLSSSLCEETASVCKALLLGDTSGISEQTTSAFRYGGIAHVFSVSGLHIGVLYAALTFAFAHIPIRRILSVAIRLAAIFFYAGVCGFAPSAVRSAVMCSVAAFATFSRKKYDSINSLSIAAIVLFCINPLYLYDVGFVLSFASVGGIFLFFRTIKRFLTALPTRLRTSLSVGISSQIATTPVLLTTFGYLSAAGLILNVAVIPFFSAIYVALLICTLACALIPVLCPYLLPTVCAPLELFINVAGEMGFENTLIYGFGGQELYVYFAIFTVTLTDKVNIKAEIRAALCCIAAFAVALSVVYSRVTPTCEVRVTARSGYSGGAATVSTPQGKTLIVSGDFSGDISDWVRECNTLVVLTESDFITAFISVGDDFDEAYMAGYNIGMSSYGHTFVTYADDFSVNGADFHFAKNVLTVSAYFRSVDFCINANSVSDDTAIYFDEDGATVIFGGVWTATDMYGETSFSFPLSAEAFPSPVVAESKE